MIEFLRTPAAQAVIWITILLNIVVVAVYLVRKWRDQVVQEDTTSEHLTKFRELHQQGVLGDVEFRTIKTALSEKLRDEMTGDRDPKGPSGKG